MKIILWQNKRPNATNSVPKKTRLTRVLKAYCPPSILPFKRRFPQSVKWLLYDKFLFPHANILYNLHNFCEVKVYTIGLCDSVDKSTTFSWTSFNILNIKYLFVAIPLIFSVCALRFVVSLQLYLQFKERG